jgi:hypothetical protein
MSNAFHRNVKLKKTPTREIREGHEDDAEAMGLDTDSSLVEYALPIVVSYFVAFMVIFHYQEGWGWLDAMYFCVTTLTTVGYGDKHAGSHSSQPLPCDPPVIPLCSPYPDTTVASHVCVLLGRRLQPQDWPWEILGMSLHYSGTGTGHDMYRRPHKPVCRTAGAEAIRTRGKRSL